MKTIHCARVAEAILLALSLACAYLGKAQTGGGFDLSWSIVAGGGGTSTGGVFKVSGTIGQSDAGKMSGGNYALDGGFWGSVAAVQSPSAPQLTMARSGVNVIISWPSPSTGFVLQQNSGVTNPTGWSNFTDTVSDNGTTKSVTLSPTTGPRFYRLKQ
jgi:hypothetical protein